MLYLLVAKGTFGIRALAAEGIGSKLWTDVWVKRFPVCDAERWFRLLVYPTTTRHISDQARMPGFVNFRAPLVLWNQILWVPSPHRSITPVSVYRVLTSRGAVA